MKSVSMHFRDPTGYRLTRDVGDYNPGNPKPSHFTQVVWKSTQRVGCAVTTCGGIFGPNSKAQYHVCEYFPAGNVIGHFP